jgi:hypothetical protein
VDQRANAIVEQALQPIARGLEARREVIRRHADYLKYEQEVAVFLERDPALKADYEAAFARDPALAMENLFLRYAQSRWNTFEADNRTARSRADAAIPTARAGEGRRGPSPNDQVQAAFERFQRTGSAGDAAAYAKARLKGVISDEWLNQWLKAIANPAGTLVDRVAQVMVVAGERVTMLAAERTWPGYSLTHFVDDTIQ